MGQININDFSILNLSGRRMDNVLKEISELDFNQLNNESNGFKKLELLHKVPSLKGNLIAYINSTNYSHKQKQSLVDFIDVLSVQIELADAKYPATTNTSPYSVLVQKSQAPKHLKKNDNSIPDHVMLIAKYCTLLLDILGAGLSVKNDIDTSSYLKELITIEDENVQQEKDANQINREHNKLLKEDIDLQKKEIEKNDRYTKKKQISMDDRKTLIDGNETIKHINSQLSKQMH
ncbi:hypothetical protein [Levilactobacillus brevis]|uniref:hypothetical protein n=1 Tax=Levilactobacillus brevis TaxID=1580 RepID=UPI0021A355CA|nr:hypothetical protein [Levilactobacillus brevis]MCT3574120.1 hypothetical protein [Levilactobacillus brevis]